jgi:hypothetical protein
LKNHRDFFLTDNTLNNFIHRNLLSLKSLGVLDDRFMTKFEYSVGIACNNYECVEIIYLAIKK